VDADAEVAVVEVFEGERVVEVLGVVGVDGERRDLAVVEAAGEFGGLDGVGERSDFAFDGGGEGGVELELVVDAGEFGARLEGFAETLDDFALEELAAFGPRGELHDDFVADGGDGLELGERGIGDGHLVKHTRVVGLHVEAAADFLEVADDGVAGAFDDLEYAAGALGAAAVAALADAGVNEDFHDVAVEGDAGVLGKNLDGFDVGGRRGGVAHGKDEGGAAGAETDAAGEGFAVGGRGGRRGVAAVLLRARLEDFAGGF
jgi:hypothetical protein